MSVTYLEPSPFFDRKYILAKDRAQIVPSRIFKLAGSFNPEDVTTWIEAIPFLKQEMDWWFHLYPKTEREFQQLMVRENNFGGTAKSTDYFICDIEYANENGRFDLIAAHWRSSSIHRKDNKNVGLAFIEMKYMEQVDGTFKASVRMFAIWRIITGETRIISPSLSGNENR